MTYYGLLHQHDTAEKFRMGEYTCYYDGHDEQLIPINTYSNKEQNWKGDEDWSIQIHYENLYDTEKQNISAVVQFYFKLRNF